MGFLILEDSEQDLPEYTFYEVMENQQVLMFEAHFEFDIHYLDFYLILSVIQLKALMATLRQVEGGCFTSSLGFKGVLGFEHQCGKLGFHHPRFT